MRAPSFACLKLILSFILATTLLSVTLAAPQTSATPPTSPTFLPTLPPTTEAASTRSTHNEATSATVPPQPTSTLEPASTGDSLTSSPDEPNEETEENVESKSIASESANANRLSVDAASDTDTAIISDPESRPTTTSAAPLEATPSSSRAPKSSGHLNMTQVDEVYVKGRKDEEETIASWHRLNQRLKNGVTRAIGSIVPFALNMSQEAHIGSECSGAMLKWILSMNQLKSWALRMLDASGKPIAGLLEGSLTMFGNYRQCLKVRAPDDDEIEFTGRFQEYFRGKYCIVQAKPWLPEKESPFYNLNTKLKGLNNYQADEDSEEGDEPKSEDPEYDRNIFDELSDWVLAFNFINVRMDLCVPSLCSREDIQKAINFLMRDFTEIKARVLRCEMDPPDGAFGAALVESGPEQLEGAINLATSSASSAKQNSTGLLSSSWPLLGWLLVPTLAIVVVLAATGLTMAIDGTCVSLGFGGCDKRRCSRIDHTLRSLSLKRSVSSHLNVDYEQLADDKPLALYGVRFLLIMWVILVESAVNLKFDYLRELMMLKDLIFWWPMQFVVNSTLQFDSIIILTAFTMGYKNCLNETSNGVRALMRFVLDKYIRLMPSIMVMVALVIVLPLIHKGPVWNDYVLKQSANCQTYGWLNSIFLQNYLPYKEMCLPQTWLICVELQLVILTAPIVYYLNKSHSRAGAKSLKSQQPGSGTLSWIRTTPGLLLCACIVFGLAGSFYNVYTNELPPSWFYTMADPDSKAYYFSKHLMRLWTHLAVFALGLGAGLECRRIARRASSRPSGRHLGDLQPSYRTINIGLIESSTPNKDSLLSGSLPALAAAIYDNSSARSTSTRNDSFNASSMSFISPSYEQITHRRPASSLGDIEETNDLEAGADSQERQKRSHSLCLHILGCLLAAATMAALIFSPHEWSLSDLPEPLVAGLFDASSRLLWSLALIWISYMVSVPSDGGRFPVLARALGHPAMVCLGKLSFLIYIIHPFVHMTVLAIQEQPIYSSWLMLFHILIGNITITVILASLVSLFVEMPCRNLFRRCGSSILLTHASTGSRESGIAASGPASASASGRTVASTSVSCGDLAAMR